MRWAKPDNRMVVGGVDLFDRFGLVMTDEMELGAPKPKVYQVDVPGGDGLIDATESISGDVAYRNRSQSFVFLAPEPRDFEATKTAVANFLAGRAFDYELSFDPGYTYRGRFTVDDWHSAMHHGTIKVLVDADPYKLKESVAVRVQAAAGAEAHLVCGRKRQCPVFTFSRDFGVEFGGRSETVRATGEGAVRFPWLRLTEGDNAVFVSIEDGGGDFELADFGDASLGSLGDSHLADYRFRERPPDDEATAVYIGYDICDL